ncbi:MAG: hypothetical protein H0T77_09440, partial [Pyrinomonadaceae bacterium]|nr:hypothetical protein [Pyrinomonadaceae bacterium]
QSQNEPRKKVRYRDQYIKFAYSSHFPFNLLNQENRCPWDQTLVFRNIQTRACAGRGGIKRGELLEDGTRTEWWAQLGEMRFEVTSRIRIDGEFEYHTHVVDSPVEAIGKGIEIVEGSYPLGLMSGEKLEQDNAAAWQLIRSSSNGHLIVTWNVAGYEKIEVTTSFDEDSPRSVNAVYRYMAVNALRANVAATRISLTSLHYASPRPFNKREILLRGAQLVANRKATGFDGN